MSHEERVAVRIDPVLDKAQRLFGWLAMAGFVAVVLFSAQSSKTFGQMLGAAAVVVLALGGVGAVLGFVFAIPRVATSRQGATPVKDGGDEERALATNTNLEDVSDWLTKMLIGVGLVQLGELRALLRDFGGAFIPMFHGAPGVDVFFASVGGAALIMSFLFVYVQTRTRGAILFAWVEKILPAIDRQQLEEAVATPQFQVDLLNPGVRTVQFGKVQPHDPIEADRAVLALLPSQIRTAGEYAAVASANARRDNLVAAASSWIEAIKRAPSDHLDYRKGLVEVLLAQKRTVDALAVMQERIAVARSEEEALDAKFDALQASLYLLPPKSFEEAEPLYAKLIESKKYERNTWVRLWAAAAIGQKALYRRAFAPASDLSDLRLKLLEQVETLKALEPDRNAAPRIFLRLLLDPSLPGGVESENDLTAFADDPDVVRAVNE